MCLEQSAHRYSCFLTLTYADQFLPDRGSLVKEHLDNFFREERRDGPLRYLGCGEYGDVSFRPHYHVCIFGRDYGYGRKVLENWKFGHCFSGSLTMASMNYVCGYITKRMMKENDVRLERVDPTTGEIYRLAPEFRCMSLRPGLGAVALPALEAFLRAPAGRQYVLERGDVPREFRFDGKRYPIARYLREKLRDTAESLPALQFTRTVAKELSVLRYSQMALDADAQSRRAVAREISRVRSSRLREKRKGVI